MSKHPVREFIDEQWATIRAYAGALSNADDISKNPTIVRQFAGRMIDAANAIDIFEATYEKGES